MDGRTALQHALVSIPVPGAPPRMTEAGAAVGLSFLDSALRLNHVRRLTERLTVVDHRVAHRATQVDVSLRMLDDGQLRATDLSRQLRGRSANGDGAIWVPVALLPRSTAAPIDIRDATGAKVPRLTGHESGELVAAGLFRLLRGILDTLPDATGDTDLRRLLTRAHEAEWLVQLAIQRLLTERRTPLLPGRRSAPEGVVEGHGAQNRALAQRVLDKYADVLADYFELFDVALDNDLLIVALDGGVDEHLLTYETPLHVTEEATPRRRAGRLLRSASEGYSLEYRSHISPGIPAYHLVVDTEPGVDIARMFLSTDADARTVATLRPDLQMLARRLADERRSPGGRGQNKILELQTQTTLRTLADLVRRRRWECAQAGLPAPDERMIACTTLGRLAVAGEGVRTRGGTVDSSILLHPMLTPAVLDQAADELVAEEMAHDVTLENDPSTSRAHAHWRGPTTTAGPTAGAPVQVMASMQMRDTTSAGPRSVRSYALAVAAAGYLLAAFLADSVWPFGPGSTAALSRIQDADAVVSVLLLVPGFLYTRLPIAHRHTVAGHLRTLPRLVAAGCIGIVAVVALAIAAGLPGVLIQIAFVAMIVLPLAGAGLLLYRRSPLPETGELVRIGAPRWLHAGAVDRSPADARFYTPLGGER
ncbi:hypothetical protein GCM10009836_72000 [Pseudonocardia ailaonensis]|uniref:Uncharacterized protein n=1 Tax=Pseudonocardia ailaonensis TaxID=367279 RepID=A0ABN2NQ48_9PSEU